MSYEIKEDSFHTGKLALNYAEGPASGPPLVLLHGGSARWQAFNSILPDLAPFYHIIAPDFRGHGRSDWQAGTYRLQDYAGDILALMRHKLTEPAYLFGHSLGGMVALLVAAQNPAGVRAVAVGDAPLTAATWGEHLREGRERLAVWRDLSGGQKSVAELVAVLKDSPAEVPGQAEPLPLRRVMGEDSPVFEWLATNIYQNDPDMLTALLERFETTAAGYEMDRVLPAIQCPVLLLQANPAAGGVMTDREVEQALPLLVQPRHVRLPGVSHVFHNERKEPIVAALKEIFV